MPPDVCEKLLKRIVVAIALLAAVSGAGYGIGYAAVVLSDQAIAGC